MKRLSYPYPNQRKTTCNRLSRPPDLKYKIVHRSADVNCAHPARGEVVIYGTPRSQRKVAVTNVSLCPRAFVLCQMGIGRSKPQPMKFAEGSKTSEALGLRAQTRQTGRRATDALDCSRHNDGRQQDTAQEHNAVGLSSRSRTPVATAAVAAAAKAARFCRLQQTCPGVRQVADFAQGIRLRERVFGKQQASLSSEIQGSPVPHPVQRPAGPRAWLCLSPPDFPPGVAPAHTKCHVRNEGGIPRLLQ